MDVEFNTRELTRLKATGKLETVYSHKYPGLMMTMTPKGTKAFYYRHKKGSTKGRWLWLGRLKDSFGVSEAVVAWKAASLELDPNKLVKKRPKKGSIPTFKEAVERLELEEWGGLAKDTVRTYKSLLKTMLLVPLGTKRLDEITISDINEIKVAYKQHGRWCNQGLSIVRRVFNASIAWGLNLPNPAGGKAVKRHKENIRERYLTPSELKRLGKAMRKYPDARAVNVLRMLIATGCRKTEILRMRWEDIDTRRKLVYIFKHKTRDITGMKTLPLTPEVKAILSGIIKHSSGWVFPSMSSRNKDPYFKNVRGVWPEILQLAGITDYRIHDLRHQFAAALADAGETLYMIQSLLGHTSSVTTQRYAKLSKKPQALASSKAARSLAKLMG